MTLSNEIPKVQDASRDGATSGNSLYAEALSAMMQTFKDKKIIKLPQSSPGCGGVDDTPESPDDTNGYKNVAPLENKLAQLQQRLAPNGEKQLLGNKKVPFLGEKQVSGVKDLLGEKEENIFEKKEAIFAKGGRYCELMNEIAQADQALENRPFLDKLITKAQDRLDHATDAKMDQEKDIRGAAHNNFSKKDWAEFSKLGPNPFEVNENQKCRTPFEFNNAQRAWLREKHPDVYKLLEKHDQASLEATRATNSVNELVQTRERPVNARLDLARYQIDSGMTDAAISTLTDLVKMRPDLIRNPGKFDRMQSLAIETGAAWDRDFRNAVEKQGGDILRYVSRPQQPMPKIKMIKLD